MPVSFAYVMIGTCERHRCAADKRVSATRSLMVFADVSWRERNTCTVLMPWGTNIHQGDQRHDKC